jgi:hypothetical protein
MPCTTHTLSTVALVASVLLAGCLGFLGPEPESFAGRYDYAVGIDASGTLTNVTIYAPLPVGPAGPPFNATVLAPDGTVDDAFEATVVETEFGPMLALRADTIAVEPRYYAIVERDGVGERVEINESEYDPANPNHQRVAFRSVDLTASLPEPYPVKTREPVGSEPVLPATATRVEAACPIPTTERAVCYTYEAPVYLSYGTAPDTTVDVIVTFEGRNEWFAGGWTGNGYRDSLTVRATGPQEGWVDGEGTLLTGNGRYRD